MPLLPILLFSSWIYSSIALFAHPWLYSFIHPSLISSNHPLLYSSIHPWLCSSIHCYFHSSIALFVHPPIAVFIHPSVHCSVYSSIDPLPLHSPIHPSHCNCHSSPNTHKTTCRKPRAAHAQNQFDTPLSRPHQPHQPTRQPAQPNPAQHRAANTSTHPIDRPRIQMELSPPTTASHRRSSTTEAYVHM